MIRRQGPPRIRRTLRGKTGGEIMGGGRTQGVQGHHPSFSCGPPDSQHFDRGLLSAVVVLRSREADRIPATRAYAARLRGSMSQRHSQHLEITGAGMPCRAPSTPRSSSASDAPVKRYSLNHCCSADVQICRRMVKRFLQFLPSSEKTPICAATSGDCPRCKLRPWIVLEGEITAFTHHEIPREIHAEEKTATL